jgi:ribosomal protein S27AE
MPLFTRTLHEVAVDTLERALCEMEPRADPREVRARAETLAALAHDYDIPLEEVEHNWIRFTHEKDRSVHAFVRWCEGVERLRRQALTDQQVCPRCYAQAAERQRDRWLCPECGEVL